MTTFGTVGSMLILLLIVAYLTICVGQIASKMGRNGILYGILFLVPGVDLVILGDLAFSKDR